MFGIFPDYAVYSRAILYINGNYFWGRSSIPARIYGATLVGNMLLCWFGKNAEKGLVRQAIVLDAFFYDLIGFITVMIFYFNGSLNSLGLGAAFIYLFLTVGFGLFLFPKK